MLSSSPIQPCHRLSSARMKNFLSPDTFCSMANMPYRAQCLLSGFIAVAPFSRKRLVRYGCRYPILTHGSTNKITTWEKSGCYRGQKESNALVYTLTCGITNERARGKQQDTAHKRKGVLVYQNCDWEGKVKDGLWSRTLKVVLLWQPDVPGQGPWVLSPELAREHPKGWNQTSRHPGSGSGST